MILPERFATALGWGVCHSRWTPFLGCAASLGARVQNPVQDSIGEVAEAPLPIRVPGGGACAPPRTIRMTWAEWPAGRFICDLCHEHHRAVESVIRHHPVGVLAGNRVAGSIEKGTK